MNQISTIKISRFVVFALISALYGIIVLTVGESSLRLAAFLVSIMSLTVLVSYAFMRDLSESLQNLVDAVEDLEDSISGESD